jgi:hypothetical protein
MLFAAASTRSSQRLLQPANLFSFGDDNTPPLTLAPHGK